MAKAKKKPQFIPSPLDYLDTDGDENKDIRHEITPKSCLPAGIKRNSLPSVLIGKFRQTILANTFRAIWGKIAFNEFFFPLFFPPRRCVCSAPPEYDGALAEARV